MSVLPTGMAVGILLYRASSVSAMSIDDPCTWINLNIGKYY
jgi:hypothetical protein